MKTWKHAVHLIFMGLWGMSPMVLAESPRLPQDGLIQQGMLIYREGRLPSGQPLQARVQNDVILEGSQAACVNCHRRSGLGTTEGGSTVMPLTVDYLFQPRTMGRKGRFQFRTQGMGTRPAYSDDSLKRAIVAGVNPAGEHLDSMMPRYLLDDEALSALITYLKSLKSRGAPGVTKETIRFATVLSEGVEEDERKAMLSVFATFFRDKNAATRHETERAAKAPWHRDWKYQAYRKWELETWILKGPPESWTDQLQAYQRERPVFAMLGGRVDGPWAPVHRFCEQEQMPCLFPNTDRPAVSETNDYTFYFSQGLVLEAKVMARFLKKDRNLEKDLRILQCYSEAGKEGADALQAELQRYGIKSSSECHLDEGGIAGLFANDRSLADVSALILWWDKPSGEALESLQSRVGPDSRMYFSSSLLGDVLAISKNIHREGIFAVHPFELPGKLSNSAMRTRTWLKRKKILDEGNFRLQANTFFTLTEVGGVIKHPLDNFSREYFIELIEHETDNALVTSVYPRLTLGPGQRFASRGGYVLRFPGNGAKPVAVTEWIVP